MTTDNRSSPLSRWGRRLREYFLVERELGEAAGRAAPLRAALQDRVDAAQRRLDGARLLRESRQDHAALLLYREGALRLARAFVDQEQGAQEPSTPDANPTAPEPLIATLASIVERERRPMPAGAAKDLAALLAGDAGDVDRLPAREATLRAESADAITRWLAGLIVVRSRRELRATRALRISIAALALLAIPVAYDVWILSPTNISVHKRVAASSAAPDSNLPAVVDDYYYGLPPYKSLEQDFPWLSIDLGHRYLITDAEVFGRHDCCFDQSVPLAFEISDDDVNYRTIATRTEPFVSLLPWVVKPLQVEARYVRVRVLRHSVLALTEIAVYGRRVRAQPAR
jgi:hypothetical protein